MRLASRQMLDKAEELDPQLSDEIAFVSIKRNGQIKTYVWDADRSRAQNAWLRRTLNKATKAACEV